jgi:membrane protein YqaA with SNARE-associated domain
LIDCFELGYWGLFAASFIAATIFPFSSEALFLFMLSKGYDATTSIVVATVGNTLGGLTCYFLGYLCKWEWLNKYIGVSEVKVLQYKKYVDSYGFILAFFCWLPFVGDILAVALGVFKSNVWLVSLFMFIGKLTRYVFLAYSVKLIFN